MRRTMRTEMGFAFSHLSCLKSVLVTLETDRNPEFYLLNSAWMHISPAHLGNVCLMTGVYQDTMCSSDNKRTAGVSCRPSFSAARGSFEGPPTVNARQGDVGRNGPAAICQWENVGSVNGIQQRQNGMSGKKTDAIIRGQGFFLYLLCLIIAKIYEINWK